MIFWNDLIFDLDHSLKNDLLRVKIKIILLILIFDLDHFTSDLAHLWRILTLPLSRNVLFCLWWEVLVTNWAAQYLQYQSNGWWNMSKLLYKISWLRGWRTLYYAFLSLCSSTWRRWGSWSRRGPTSTRCPCLASGSSCRDELYKNRFSRKTDSR